jgi:hypothetical protein
MEFYEFFFLLKLLTRSIRTVLHERCTNIGLSVPGITSQTFEEYGGPHNTLDSLTKVYYSSHYEKIFKQVDPRFHTHLLPSRSPDDVS